MHGLTRSQMAIYEMDRFGGGAIANISSDIFFDKEYNIDELYSAIRSLLSRCETMHTRIVIENEIPMQYICSEIDDDIPLIHFESTSDYEVWAAEQAKKPVDIYGKLYRIFVVDVCGDRGVYCVLHHIIGDAWSMGVIAERLCEILSGKDIQQIFPYSNSIKADESYAQSKRFGKDEAFWIQTYDDNNEVSFLSENQVKSNVARRAHYALTKEQSDLIKVYCKETGVSEYTLFLSAVSAYFYRVTEKENFYIGTPVINRSTIEEKNTIGAFINTIPLSVNTNGEMSFKALSEQIDESVSSAFRHQKYPYSLLLKTLRDKKNRTDVLFDVMLSYQNLKINGEAKVHWYSCGAQTESLQIHIDDRNCDDIFYFNYDYQIEKFNADEIRRIHSQILNLLFSGINIPEQPVHLLKLMSNAEYNKVVCEFNDTAVDYPRDKCVHQLFEEQVKKTPAKTAVVACDKTLTYSELNTEANRIAHRLIENGVKYGDIVAFKLHRRSYLLATMFGILKTGATYMPIDPDYPNDRVEYMLEDSNANYCIDDENIDELLNNESTENLSVNINSGIGCYCIYTSGSTGKPKGTLLTHQNVVNYCNNNKNNNVVNFIIKDSYKTIAATTTVGFDIFVTESILPLLNGFTIILADESQAKIQSELNELLREHPADVLQTTPTKMKILSANPEHADYLRLLKAIILGGEAFDVSLYETLHKMTDAHIFNIYGPTEATVWVTNTEVTSSDITIGKPMANTQIYILDKYLNPVPIGVSGELCIAGDCVGAGYLNRPELTAEKFIDNPFGKGRMYKTGDLAKWREDGNIEYIGRNDFQVKIRGLRIELGEIENAICSVDGISQSVAVVRKNENGRQFICAFYTGTDIDRSVIREQIAKKLPKYMLPHIFTHLDEMPLTASGKTNRNALPDVNLENIASDTEYVAPETETEKQLCSIIAKTLGVEKVGINDDFFDIGGDSLKAIEYVAKAHNNGIDFTLQSVFDYPTIKKLCGFIVCGEEKQSVYAAEEFIKYKNILNQNVIDNSFVPHKKSIGNVLLTGATGFLGAHILDNFMKNESGKIYCLVRSSEEKLRSTLKYYFDDIYDIEIGRRIIPVIGDIEKYGLAEDITSDIQTVIHTAASVKHYGSYKYFHTVNVVGTRNVVEYAKRIGAKLIHISTLSVSGNSLTDDFDLYRSEHEKHFDETSFYIEQPLENVYIRSKFEAEISVMDAILDGLDAKIIRVGNLTNRESDFKFQPNYRENAFLSRIKAALDFGLFPDYLMPLYAEFSPVDITADGVVKIAQYADTQKVFHLNSNKPIYFEKMLEVLKKLDIEMKVVNAEQFNSNLQQIAKNSQTEYIYEAFENDMDENGKLVYDSNIRIINDFTDWFMGKVNFAWKQTDFDYIKGYVEYFRNLGYFNK